MKNKRNTMILETLILIPFLTTAFAILFALRVSLIDGTVLDLTARRMWGTGFVVALLITSLYELGLRERSSFDWRVFAGSIDLMVLSTILAYSLLPVEFVARINGLPPRALQESALMLGVLDGIVNGGVIGLLVGALDRQAAPMRVSKFLILFFLLSFLFILLRYFRLLLKLNDTIEGVLAVIMFVLLEYTLKWWRKKRHLEM